jgi:hypothetical protein
MSQGPSFQQPIHYFLHEGKENLRHCLQLSFEAALRHDITRLIIFTGMGEGVKIALQEYLTRPEYSNIKLVAVSFPQGKVATPVNSEDLELFGANHIPFIRAHLPFDPIHGTYHERGIGQGLSLLGSVLEAFAGSMNLCVQAALMACDAFAIEAGEHAIALSADTSILVRTCPTCDFLTDFIVREIVCKPAILTISKKEDRQQEAQEEAVPEGKTITIEPKELASGQSE